MFYRYLIRPLLFQYSVDDPERAHELVLKLFQFGKCKTLARMLEELFTVDDPALEQNIFGLRFRNPVGLAAGFDKNAVVLQGLQSLGFGFLEAGTVTRYEQEGNPRPRIFRFPKNEVIINRMGFNNDGADKVATRLVETKRLAIPLGINLGKSKITPLENAVDDYLYSLRKLYPYGDFFIVNVSSPNTPGLRQLQEKKYLDALLSVLQKEAKILAGDKNKPKPILVKIAPDLSWEAIDELLQVCFDRGVAGIIAVNTTITRDGLSIPIEEEGGLSGKPLWSKSISIVHHIYQQTKGKLLIIGVGGISGPREAYEMLQAGASLIQVYTGFVYKGPFLIRQINQGLKRLMTCDGICTISELKHRISY